MDQLGFVRYEVSNFAQPGHESVHNLGYWRANPYLGLGPSATSTVPTPDGVVRFVQPISHSAFLSGHPYWGAAREPLSTRELITEELMLGLRIAEGIDLAGFHDRFGLRLESLVGDILPRLETDGLLFIRAGRLCPTGRGMDLLKSVLVELLGAIDDSGLI